MGTSDYEDRSEKFHLREFDYQKQYCHLYLRRLEELTALLAPLAQKRWGAQHPIRKLCELREEQPETCIVIGTTYKHQTHKPSILREISEENQLAPQPARLHYAEPDDKLILEDELQRVRLCGEVDARLMATGIVCAVLGTIQEGGRFDVESVMCYDAGPQRPLAERKDNGLLVLVSGLDGVHTGTHAAELELFQHWLTGHMMMKSSKNKGQLVRMIVAGNSLRVSDGASSTTAQRSGAGGSGINDPVCSLDAWFAAWSRTVPVDIMPGAFDPANMMLPQQPYHNCMFPLAQQLKAFRCVTNPYECCVNDALIVGCAGQNVRDLQRSTMIESPLEALRSTLVWSHIAPTAPDTLECYPFLSKDPFILRECPHIYFAGNSDAYATQLHSGPMGQRTRLVCVPSFHLTRSVAVVNLQTLDCQEIRFDVKHK